MFANIREALAARVAAAVPEVEVLALPERELPADGVRGEVLLTYPWAAENLQPILARGVRWVHALGTGVDGFPVGLLGDRVLTCSRGASAVPIAEWVLAVMLAAEKDLPAAWIHAPPAEGWSRGRRGVLSGRTLALIGFGGIGQAVAARALPFGMRVRAVRRTAAPSPLAGVELIDDLAALVADADHLVLAAPATAATRHLLDAALLARVKPGLHLVNIARGALVDQDALRVALDDGRVALASLDAVDPEPLPAGHWLYSHPRVRLSPHISYQMPGAADALLAPFIDNLRRYQRGEPLQDVVDVAAGY
ncbi:MAG: NAD(P)-dependent oxidoreductase [Deltaproteobacteria bacterium]|nr:NAD(P)-dependent oxidoreductase [Deltaproteobacteria bacterium]